MPLNKSGTKEALHQNIKTLMGEVGVSPRVQSRNQALAVAYSIKRRARADGGPVHVGPISSTVPGRTDKHPLDVPSGAYVVPSECVSNLGENNTNAGMVKLDAVLKGSPDQIRKFFDAKAPSKRASGGAAPSHAAVPIMAAGGEYVIDPQHVAIIGNGDIKTGHAILDAWVLSRRKNHIKTLRGLAPPAKD